MESNDKLPANVKDITGCKFGKLTVLGFAYSNGSSYWNCKCDCGVESIVSRIILKATKNPKCRTTKECRKTGERSTNFKDLTGQKFGRLQVLRINDRVRTFIRWKCLCDCGNTTCVVGTSLTRGTTKSCGCLANELTSNRKLTNILGQKFSNYTIIGRKRGFFESGKEIAKWECKCDCGNIMYFDTETIVKNENRKTCRKCYSTYYHGENHPSWNHNTKDRNIKRNSTICYNFWRKSVYERDNFICQITGKTGNLCAHHIEAWATCKELRYDINNGITILASVHRYFHKLYGQTGNTREQFEEFRSKLTKEEIDSFN